MIRSKCIPIRDNCSRSFYSAILTCTALFTVHYVGVIKILGIFLHLSKASSETPPFIASHQPLLWMHFSNASHLYAPLQYATLHPTPPLNALFKRLSSIRTPSVCNLPSNASSECTFPTPLIYNIRTPFVHSPPSNTSSVSTFPTPLIYAPPERHPSNASSLCTFQTSLIFSPLEQLLSMHSLTHPLYSLSNASHLYAPLEHLLSILLSSAYRLQYTPLWYLRYKYLTNVFTQCTTPMPHIYAPLQCLLSTHRSNPSFPSTSAASPTLYHKISRSYYQCTLPAPVLHHSGNHPRIFNTHDT